jgi:hypothetical protein
MQNSGPWDYRNPAEYFTSLAKGFSTEVGTPSFPTLESFQSFTSEPDQWPVNDVWAYHDWHSQGGGNTKGFTDAMAEQYGAPKSLIDFEKRAQLMNLQSHRAIFEGMNAGLWSVNSGRLLWMTQPAWPSTEWQILSHDYDTHASYYGVKSAAEPIHVQMNLPDYKLQVINNPNSKLDGAKLNFKVVDLNGNLLLQGTKNIQVAANTPSGLYDVGIASQLKSKGLVFVSLKLHDKQGKELSQNFYWISADNSSMQKLSALPEIKLQLKAKLVEAQGTKRYLINLFNPNSVPAISAKITIFDKSGKRILPAYYSDNYVSLMPNESREIVVDLPNGQVDSVQLRGWNVTSQSLSISP